MPTRSLKPRPSYSLTSHPSPLTTKFNNNEKKNKRNRHFVWTVAKGVAHKRSVGIGELLPEGVVVSSGLAEGDEVIVEGAQKVSEGMRIEIKN